MTPSPVWLRLDAFGVPRGEEVGAALDPALHLRALGKVESAVAQVTVVAPSKRLEPDGPAVAHEEAELGLGVLRLGVDPGVEGGGAFDAADLLDGPAEEAPLVPTSELTEQQATLRAVDRRGDRGDAAGDDQPGEGPCPL